MVLPDFRWGMRESPSEGSKPIDALAWRSAVHRHLRGLDLGHHRGGIGRTDPLESYVFSCVLSLISIGAGWAIAVALGQLQKADRDQADARQKEDLERTARSAVTRSFRIMAAFGRIQELTQDEEVAAAELRVRQRVVCELAASNRLQMEDSIHDWRRFAEEAVNDELKRAQAKQIGEPYE
ncbi:hypothetical protein [Nocardia nova]|uniref:hypothetical protein n=1 Tax=Nocardia nova TaxID=37330 RepID=UPI0033EA152A